MRSSGGWPGTSSISWMPPNRSFRNARHRFRGASLRWFLTLLSAVGAQASHGLPLANQLRDHPSPYLAMHGEDPVAWQDWSAEVLTGARAAKKLVLVSSGYFACHWCHVMQRESYRNPEIAALINAGFVPVKLDRELHPALDEYLIRFTEHTSGQAGWPLNVVLTPEGHPLIGVTYLPPERFRAVLAGILQLWSEDPVRLARLARDAAGELQRAAVPDTAALPAGNGDLAARLRSEALRIGDELLGGFGGQSRFPMEPQLSVLLDLVASTGDPDLARFLRLTFDQMARHGLRDHLGGGFFRYTVDPDWQTPHFEKMLYTQALLAPLYLRAAAVLERPDYRGVAREVLDFALQSMRREDGGFIASLSALDADGVEGGYYLWRGNELERVLSPGERALAARVWALDGPPLFEAGRLPIGAQPLEAAARESGMAPEAAARLLDSARLKLLGARANRTLPRDEKVLAGWNGLMLSALVDGYRAFQVPLYREAAEALRNHLVSRLWDGKQLLRALGPSGPLGVASLEDYAFLARGLRDWSEVTGSRADRELALALVREAWGGFYDRGWRLSARTPLPDIPAEAALSDSPLPSPASVILRLSLGSGDQELTRRATEALQAGRATVLERPFFYATQAALMIEHEGPRPSAAGAPPRPKKVEE